MIEPDVVPFDDLREIGPHVVERDSSIRRPRHRGTALARVEHQECVARHDGLAHGDVDGRVV